MNLFRRLIKRAERAYLSYAIGEERPDLIGLPFIQQLRTYTHESIRDFVKDGVEGEPPRLVRRALAYESTDGSRSFWVSRYFLVNAQHQLLRDEYDELEEKSRAEMEVMRQEHKEAMALLKQAVDTLTQIQNPANKLN